MELDNSQKETRNSSSELFRIKNAYEESILFSFNNNSWSTMTILKRLCRACNLTAFIHSSTGPVVHPFASLHEGPGFNLQGGTYSMWNRDFPVCVSRYSGDPDQVVPFVLYTVPLYTHTSASKSAICSLFRLPKWHFFNPILQCPFHWLPLSKHFSL